MAPLHSFRADGTVYPLPLASPFGGPLRKGEHTTVDNHRVSYQHTNRPAGLTRLGQAESAVGVEPFVVNERGSVCILSAIRSI